MSDTALYRKWRSQTFADLVGQQHVSRTLLNALAQGRVGHAYLFCGPRGVGKTSIARLLAKAINCETNGGRGEPCNTCRLCREIAEGRCLDVLEIDGASNNSVENVRDLRDKIQYTPSEARYKVYIIDEVHRLSPSAFDALLKTLEEPPPHAKFMFASTEKHRIPATILSRCQRFDLRRIPLKDAVGRLAQICEAEGIGYEPAALELIARTATGSLRDAISLLDQLRSMAIDRVTLEDAQALIGAGGGQGAAELAQALADRDAAAALRQIDRLAGEGIDFRQLTTDLIDYLRAVLLIRTGSGAEMLDVPADQRAEMEALAPRFELGYLVRALKLLNSLDFSARSTHPQLPLELALVEAITGEAPAVRPAPATTPSAAPARREPVRRQAGPAAGPQNVPAPTTASPSAPAPAPSAAASTNGRAAEVAEAATPEEAAQAATTAPGRAPGEARDLDIELIRVRWREFIDSLDRGPLRAVLIDVAPRDWDGAVLTLATAMAFHQQRLNHPEARARAETALRDFFGVPMGIKVTLVPKDELRTRSDALQDPVVRAAQAQGARIKRVVSDEEG